MGVEREGGSHGPLISQKGCPEPPSQLVAQLLLERGSLTPCPIPFQPQVGISHFCKPGTRGPLRGSHLPSAYRGRSPWRKAFSRGLGAPKEVETRESPPTDLAVGMALPDVHGAGMRDETRRCAGRGLPVDMRARPAWWKAGHPAGAVEGGGSCRDARDTDRAGMCRQPRQARGQSETQPGRRAEPQGPCLGLSGSGAHSC